MATELELLVGTNAQCLLCYKINKCDDETLTMEKVIANQSHHSPSSIRCMDVNGKYLATGGSDGRIVITDLKLNKEVQSINTHKSSVNAISFTADGSHFLSGSEDGKLMATKVGSWAKDNMWHKPHTGKAIMKVCIHKSSKVAFTLGKDGMLLSWSMFEKRQINTTNVKDLSETRVIMDNLELCPNGEVFAMSGLKTVTIISVICGKMYDELQLEWQITSMCWIDDQNLLIGMENGSIEWTNIVDAKHQNIPEVHTNRVKGMHYLNGFLATICSSGDLTLWSISISEKKLTQICTINDSCRPTCVKLINTTENRYKGETKIETVELKEPVVEQLTKSTHLQTAAKVIIEIDGNGDNKTHGVITNKTRKIRTTSAEKNLEITSTAIPLLEKKKIRVTSAERDFGITSNENVTEKNQKRGSAKQESLKKKPISTHSDNSVDDVDRKETPMKESQIKTPTKESNIKNKMIVRLSKRSRSVNEYDVISTPPLNKKFKTKSPNVSPTDEIDPLAEKREDKRNDEFDRLETDNKQKKKSKIEKGSQNKQQLSGATSKSLSINSTERNDSNNNQSNQKQQQSTAASKKKIDKKLNINESTTIDPLAEKREDKRNDEFDRLETDNKQKKKSKIEKGSQNKQQLSGATSKSLSINSTERNDSNNNQSNQKQQQSTAASKKKIDKKLNINESTTIMTRNKLKSNTK